MKLTKRNGCYFNDRIDCEFSPADLEWLLTNARQEALTTKDYIARGAWRDIVDYLKDRHNKWEELRNEKDRE